MTENVVPGFAVGVRRTQVTLSTPRLASISRYALSAEEAATLANLLWSASLLADIEENRNALLRAFARGNRELHAAADCDRPDLSGNGSEGVLSTDTGKLPVRLSRSRRDAELAQLLGETSRALSRVAQLLAADSGRER